MFRISNSSFGRKVTLHPKGNLAIGVEIVQGMLLFDREVEDVRLPDSRKVILQPGQKQFRGWTSSTERCFVFRVQYSGVGCKVTLHPKGNLEIKV